MDTVTVDYAGEAARVAAMRIGGMTVLERLLREAARDGASRAVVRGEPSLLPSLPSLPIAVELLPPSATLPGEARKIPGDVIAGVALADAGSRRRAERALLETCRRPHDGLGDRYIIRAISLRLTRVFAGARVTPNQVTAVNIAVGFFACWLVHLGTRGAVAAGGALMWLQVILDSSDGELARIRHLGSRFGMWLDNVSDDVIDNAFVAALGIGLGGAYAVAGIAAALMRSLCAIMIYVDVGRRGKPGDVMAFHWWFEHPDAELGERFAPRLTPLVLVRSLGRRDVYPLLWGLACVAGAPLVALALGVVLCVAYFGMAVIHTTIVWARGRIRN